MYFGKVINKDTGMPIKGAKVSDGMNITITDENGNYTLNGWDKAHLIYVNTLTNSLDDWYVYIDQSITNYDFYISPVEVPSDFSFLHISDTEILSENDKTTWINFARDTVTKHSPAFFVHTGDIAREFGMTKHKEVMNPDTVGCPVRYTIGNHDFSERDYGEQFYEMNYGPTWYSFDCGDIHFVVLSIAGFESTDFLSAYERDDQLKWLEKDMALVDSSKRTVVLCHTFCYRDALGLCPTLKGCEKTYNLKKYNFLAWAYGHTHVNYMHNIDGFFYINSSRPDSGGVDSSEGAIRKVTLNGHKISSEMIYCMPYELKKDAFVWENKLPGKINFCTPLHVDDSIVVGTIDDGYPKECGIFRIDTKNGNIIWSFPTSNSITGDLSYDNGKIYAQDNFGKVYCIDFENGSELWSVDKRLNETSYTRSGTLIADDILITGTPKCIRALNKNTGELVWEYTYKRGEDTPAKFLYDKNNRQIILNSHWYALVALDYDTGEVKWANTDGYLWFRTSTPLLLNNTLYIASRGKYFSVNATSGEIIKCEDSKGLHFEVQASPVSCGNTLYISTSIAGVVAIDQDTFEEIHRFPCGNADLFPVPYLGGEVQTVEATPVIDGDKLIFSALDGTVRFYDRHTKELLKTINVGSPILHSPIILSDSIITADFDGNITKFSIY